MMNCCAILAPLKDGRLHASPLRHGSPVGLHVVLLSRGLQTEPRLAGRHSSSRQIQPQRIRAATAATAATTTTTGGLRVATEAAGLLLVRPRRRGGAGVQPGGSARDGAPLPEARLVQDAAAEADHPRGGLRQPHHHQPLLLRTVQLLLHPPACAQGGGGFPVVLLL